MQGSLCRKDLTRPKSEEDSPSTKQPVAVSVEKIDQCIQKQLGRTSINATFSVDSYENNVLVWLNVHDIVDEGSHAPWARFLGEFGNPFKTQKIENIEKCVQRHSKKYYQSILKKFWMWRPLILIHLHGRDQHCSTTTWIKWAKAKVCVYADSVLCVGKTEEKYSSRRCKMDRTNWRSQNVTVRPQSFSELIPAARKIEFESCK